MHDQECFEKGSERFKEGDLYGAIYYYRLGTRRKGSLCLNALGYCYAEGKGVKRNLRKAKILFERAAEQGNPKAIRNLGLAYLQGLGVRKSKVKAFHYFLRSAEAGFDQGMVNLANCYFYGVGVRKDRAKAMEWYQKAAGLHNPSALCQLGLLNQEELDEAKAVSYFQKAAELGDVLAMHYLAEDYRRGMGVDKDEEQARYWDEKAKKAGWGD
jgi:TPR repeat protein